MIPLPFLHRPFETVSPHETDPAFNAAKFKMRAEAARSRAEARGLINEGKAHGVDVEVIDNGGLLDDDPLNNDIIDGPVPGPVKGVK